MRKVVRLNRFCRDVKEMQRQGKDLQHLGQVIAAAISGSCAARQLARTTRIAYRA